MNEMTPMGELRLVISDQLHRKLKQIALEKNTTLKGLVATILTEYTNRHNKGDGE